MKQYVSYPQPEKKEVAEKKKKDSKSVVTKKDYGLTENAKVLLE